MTSEAARGRLPLLALLALFVGLSGLYNATVPLGEGPDEPGHLRYVLFVAFEGRLPVQRLPAEESDVPGEGHQPPLAYLLAAPAVAWLPPEERALHLSADPRFVWSGGDSPAAFSRGSRELWPWAGLSLAWHLARAVSGLWGALTVVCVYLAGRELGRPGLALLAAALVALNPQFLFTTALVTNDPLLAALCAAALWLALRHARSPGAAGGLALGLVFGLALLTKQSALVLGPLLAWASWRAAGGNGARFLLDGLRWGLTALAVAGWWYARNWALYGDPLGLALFQAKFAGQAFAWGSVEAWRGGLSQLFASYWARFGWMSLPAPSWVVALYGGVTLVGLAGLARRLADGRLRPGGTAWQGPAILAATVAAWLLSFAETAGLVAWQGRLLFPAVSAVALALAAGWLRLLRAPLARRPALLAGAVALLALPPAYLPPATIGPAYEWHVLAPAAAQASLGTPVYARFARSWKRGVELRGWQLQGAPAPGRPLELRLTWHALEPIPESWTVFVHLVDGQGQIIAESNSVPQGGAWPMPRWTPGDWVGDTHRLELPADLPPGAYTLRAGLYRPEKDGRREASWDAAGERLGDDVALGAVTIP